jgi:hypothetical protein
MILAILTFLTGIAISAVAIYYSVLGLASIFSGAVLPIMVMGAILEISKLVAAWWLKANWHRAPMLLKSYLLMATVVLMLITSMGIFGFLSKAHSDQSLATGDVGSQVAIYDEQIKIERENITNAQSLIKQMDDAVNGIQANGESREIKLRDGRTYTRSAAELALSTRRSQAKDRAALTAQIQEAQAKIVDLQKQKAPIAAKQREVEAEVGPIKYIAAFVYGDNPGQNLLEKAVTWVIITIVFVFDPLAVLLLLASQMSFGWARENKKSKSVEEVQDTGDYLRQPEPEISHDETRDINLSLSEDKEPDIDNTIKSIEEASDSEPTIVEKIVEVERRVEVPVETVIEKIVEVPVEKIVEVERIVEKIVEVPVLVDEFNQIMAVNKTSGLEGLIAQKQKLLAKKDAEIAALKEVVASKTLTPDNIQADNLGNATNSGFGTEFPKTPVKGDTFLRVDYLPTKLYKWNSKKWIEVDKNINDGYAYNEEYIKHLATQLEQGKYSIDDLSDVEQEEIKRYLEGK